MKLKNIAVYSAIAILTSSAAIAQVDQNNQTAQPDHSKTLLAAFISGASTGFTQGIGSGATNFINSMFDKLSNLLFGTPMPHDINKQQQQQQQQSYQQQQNTVQVNNLTTSIPAGGVMPSIAYRIEQLDPNNYATIRTLENVNSNTPQFKTGDVFAIIYETNMPGQVRLENIDSQNVTSQLGIYNVIAHSSRRLPEKKGFQMTGAQGNELMNIYFTPCRPPEAANKPGVVEFVALPLCSNTQLSNLSKAGKSGGIRPKAIANQDSPDPNIAIGVSTDVYTKEDLQNGVPTKSEIRVIHGDGV